MRSPVGPASRKFKAANGPTILSQVSALGFSSSVAGGCEAAELSCTLWICWMCRFVRITEYVAVPLSTGSACNTTDDMFLVYLSSIIIHEYNSRTTPYMEESTWPNGNNATRQGKKRRLRRDRPVQAVPPISARLLEHGTIQWTSGPVEPALAPPVARPKRQLGPPFSAGRPIRGHHPM